MSELAHRLRREVARARQGSKREDPTQYRGRPVDYAHEFLELKPGLWSVQQEIARAIHERPYKVLVKAAHALGKTFLAAVLVNYWYDVFPDDSAVITTAQSNRDVKEILWREVRLLRTAAGLGGFRGPDSPDLRDGPNHYAKGFCAEKGEMFQGRHLKHMLFIFDEACLLKAPYWITTASMFQPGGMHSWLAIGNPTDPSSQMYAEDIGGGWAPIRMSALDHPNIAKQLRGETPDYPTAVTLPMEEGWLNNPSWATPVPDGEQMPGDIEWPPPVPCPSCGSNDA
jgi:hypothetical protein